MIIFSIPQANAEDMGDAIPAERPGTISCTNIYADATSLQGVNVSYNCTIFMRWENSSYELVEKTVPIICDPKSGSLFPIGRTPIKCYYHSYPGSSSITSEYGTTIGVTDQPPTITSLGDVTFEPIDVSIDSVHGAFVSFDSLATAVDAIDGTVPISCGEGIPSPYTYTVSETPHIVFYPGSNSYTLNCSATDSNGNKSDIIHLIVTVNSIPVEEDEPELLAVDDIVIKQETGGVMIEVLKNDKGNNITILPDLLDQPNSGLVTFFTGSDDILWYNPVGSYTATEFSYTITNDGGITKSTAKVIISYDIGPTAVKDQDIIISGIPKLYDVTQNDVDPLGQGLTIVSVTPPRNGAHAEIRDNKIIFDAIDDYKGDDSFTYTIKDGSGKTSTGDILITITNAPPFAFDDFARSIEYKPVTIDVLKNDKDLNLDKLTIVDVQSETQLGTITHDGKTVTYTPNLTSFEEAEEYAKGGLYQGLEWFKYTVSDGDGFQRQADVEVEWVTDTIESSSEIIQEETEHLRIYYEGDQRLDVIKRFENSAGFIPPSAIEECAKNLQEKINSCEISPENENWNTRFAMSAMVEDDSGKVIYDDYIDAFLIGPKECSGQGKVGDEVPIQIYGEFIRQYEKTTYFTDTDIVPKTKPVSTPDEIGGTWSVSCKASCQSWTCDDPSLEQDIPIDDIPEIDTIPPPSDSTTPETITPETITPETITPETIEIPKWIKNNAAWYAEKKISDKEFAIGIGFMIREEIIKIDDIKVDKEADLVISDDIKIPNWVQNSAKWWAEDLISDEDFKAGIAFLVNEKIIDISGGEKNTPTQELQLIKSSLNGSLFNTIISDQTVQNKEKAVETLVKIATVNQISGKIHLEIRNYLDKFLDDEIEKAWKAHSDQQSTETQNYAISLEKMFEQNKKDQTEWATLSNNSFNAREDLLNSAQKAGFDKASLKKMLIEEIEKSEDKIRSESDLKNAIKDLKSLKQDFGGLLFQLDLELDVSDFGTNSDAVILWCTPQQLDAADSKLIASVCADIPTT